MKQVNNYLCTAIVILVVSSLITYSALAVIPYLINLNKETELKNSTPYVHKDSPALLDSAKIEVYDNDSQAVLTTLFLDKTIDKNSLSELEVLWDELTEPLRYNIFPFLVFPPEDTAASKTVVVTLNYNKSQLTAFNYRLDGDIDIWSFSNTTEMTNCMSGSKRIAEYVNSLMEKQY